MRALKIAVPAVVATAAVSALVVGPGLWRASVDGSPRAALPTGPPPPAPVAVVVGLHAGVVPWDAPLRLAVSHGVLVSVSVAVSDATGGVLPGAVAAGGSRWASSTTLVPLTTYRASIVIHGLDGRDHDDELTARAADAASHLDVILSPGDGDIVGVGQPAIVYLNHWVPDAERAAVEERLSVATTPAVTGAWHWMSGQEVHWRPKTYWAPGTTVAIHSDLRNLDVGGGVWGTGVHTATFMIGDAHISIADVAAHLMRVYSNGQLVRTLKISAGRLKYPTQGGVYIALEKDPMVVMDSQTVGIPRNSPDGYYEKVYWDVRLSYGGTFVHAAPWSVQSQGVDNVSHGCINVSPADAQWFYNFARRGDVVKVVNSAIGPNLSDPGMEDWNLDWQQWLAGDALPPAPSPSPSAPAAYRWRP